MKSLLKFAALAVMLAPVPAMAQQWYRVSDGEELRSYVDLASLKKEGDLVGAETMLAVVKAIPGNDVRWLRSTVKFDCTGRRTYIVRAVAYDENRQVLTTLEDPDKGAPRPVKEGTDAVFMLGYACNTNRNGAVRVADPMNDPR